MTEITGACGPKKLEWVEFTPIYKGDRHYWAAWSINVRLHIDEVGSRYCCCTDVEPYSFPTLQEAKEHCREFHNRLWLSVSERRECGCIMRGLPLFYVVEGGANCARVKPILANFCPNCGGLITTSDAGAASE